MVKAMADPCMTLLPGGMLDEHHMKMNSLLFCDATAKFSNSGPGVAKPTVALEITPSKKPRNSLRSFFFSSNKKTKRKDTSGNGDCGGEGGSDRPYLRDEHARQRLCDVSVDRLVERPPEMELNEWLATHTIKFFEHINYLYGAISDYCTCQTCASMTGPNNVQYQWVDDRSKKVKVTASQYIEYVTAYAEKTICDEHVFPTKYGNVFPSSFEATVRKLSRLLLHVLAHMYHAHFTQLSLFELTPFINTVTLHFVQFAKRFSLLESRDLEPLDELYNKLHTSHSVAAVSTPSSAGGSSPSRATTPSRDWSKASLVPSANSVSAAEVVTERGGDVRGKSLSPTLSDSCPVPSLSTSNTSLSGVHVRLSAGASSTDGFSSSPTRRSKNGSGSNGSVHGLLMASGGGKATLTQLVSAMEENKENLLQLSSSQPSTVLTKQPNGHPRKPSS